MKLVLGVFPPQDIVGVQSQFVRFAKRWLVRNIRIFLDEVAGRHPHNRVIMILDGAGWHKSAELKITNNIRLINLPPYSPELNPVEHILDELREKYFYNRVFESIDALENHLETALRNM